MNLNPAILMATPNLVNKLSKNQAKDNYPAGISKLVPFLPKNMATLFSLECLETQTDS